MKNKSLYVCQHALTMGCQVKVPVMCVIVYEQVCCEEIILHSKLPYKLFGALENAGKGKFHGK